MEGVSGVPARRSSLVPKTLVTVSVHYRYIHILVNTKKTTLDSQQAVRY